MSRSREGFRHAKEVLVNRNIRIDTDTDEAIRLLSVAQGRPWSTVARDLLVRGLANHQFQAALVTGGVSKTLP